MKDNGIYITGAARTAIGSFNGALANTGAVELGCVAAREAMNRARVSPTDVDEVILGCVLQAGAGQNVARQVLVKSGIPVERCGQTVNMVCGSGLLSVVSAAQAIRCGDASVVVAGGTESMSQAPYLLTKARSGYRMGNGEIVDSMIHEGLLDIFNGYHMGMTAENLAQKYGITREEQDRFSVESQHRTEKAILAGAFTDEITPVMVAQKRGEPTPFAIDEFPRFGTTLDALARLRPAFKENGTVTAGNSSGINDGAAALVVAGADAVKARALAPLARIVSYGRSGCDPSIMGIGPVEAVRIALKHAGWNIADIDLVEANEAFAAQALAVSRELAWDMEKVNVNGGAIALGHPIGASGARILVTLLYEMLRREAHRGLATLCVGGGMGIAVCVER